MQEGIVDGVTDSVTPEHVPTSNGSVSLSQDRLNDLIREKHNHAYAKGKSEGLAEAESRLKAEVEAKIKSELDPEKLRHLMAEHTDRIAQEHQRKLQQAEADKIVHSFISKMKDGESPDPSLDELVQNMNLQNIAPIVELAAESPHTKHIMYDLVKNPQKMTHLITLAHLDPMLARKEIEKLTQSIEMNKNAQPHDVKQPLTQVQPSTIGSGSGKLSIKDLRRQSHLIR
jgi:hypothetical protein